MRKKCNIIKDLIPMYVEKLTSEDSNQFIKDHLSSCQDCTNYLRNIERDLPNDVFLDMDQENNDQKLIKGIKYRITRIKFLAILIGLFLGLSVSLEFFPAGLVGIVSFLLLIALLIYLLRNN